MILIIMMRRIEKQKIFQGSADGKQKEILAVDLQRLKLGKQSPVQMKDISIYAAAQEKGSDTSKGQSCGNEKKNADRGI